MTAEVSRPRRVLHVLKHYPTEPDGELLFLERTSAVMQEIAPGTTHDLLVTHTPRPDRAAAACTTLERVIHLSPRPLGTWRRQMAMAAWLLVNLRRYATVHFRSHADRYFVSYALVRFMGRRLVLSVTADGSLPVLVDRYRPGLRRLAERGFGLFHAFVGDCPKLLDETKQIADPTRCHLVPRGLAVAETSASKRALKRAELGIGATDPVLLFMGGLSARGDTLFVIDAMPRILSAHPRAHLLLVGGQLEPEHAGALVAAIARLGLQERILLGGDQMEQHPWFAAADILVLASEHPGTVESEAMLHSLRIVALRPPQMNDSFDTEGYVAAVDGLLRGTARAGNDATSHDSANEQLGMRSVASRYLGIYGAAKPGVAHNPEGAPPPERENRPETGLGYGASILDTRFHTPVRLAPTMQPLLITMVDAEEAFDWSMPFRRDATDVSSMGQQWRAHRIFERHGVVPLYLADHPVAVQDAGRQPLRDLLRSGACEVGAQMHPWLTPPYDETIGERNSYAGNLPVELELAKARHLTRILGEAFGEAPRIFRTGRFGAGPRTADILRSLGYAADSSVTPCWPPEGAIRPWLEANPYWTDREKTLMEIPVSAALVGGLSNATALAPFVLHSRMERLHLAGAMSRLGLMERIRLSPEGMTISEACRLARHMLATGHRVFVLTYHSPSLVPGNTPYVRSGEDLARFLDWLDQFYGFFASELGGRFGSWRDLRFGGTTLPMAAP